MRRAFRRDGTEITGDYFAIEELLKDVESRQLGLTTIPAGTSEVHGASISTVFLVIDRQMRPGGPPLLYQTARIDSRGAIEDLENYTTEVEAIAGHARWVALELAR